jgi:hypothetical protein
MKYWSPESSRNDLRRLARIIGSLDASDAEFLRDVVSGDRPLANRPGQRSLTTIEALTMRDRWLREAATQFFPGRPAGDIHSAWQRYANTAWQRERVLSTCPARHVGRSAEFFWRALLANPRVLSVRQLQRVLKD